MSWSVFFTWLSSVNASGTAFLRGSSIDHESDSKDVIQFGQISADSIGLDENPTSGV